MDGIEETTHVRVARPARGLAAVERFWVEGLGMRVMCRVTSAPGDPDHTHDLLMVGWPVAG